MTGGTSASDHIVLLRIRHKIFEDRSFTELLFTEVYLDEHREYFLSRVPYVIENNSYNHSFQIEVFRLRRSSPSLSR
jgi:hypothetical protein